MNNALSIIAAGCIGELSKELDDLKSPEIHGQLLGYTDAKL